MMWSFLKISLFGIVVISFYWGSLKLVFAHTPIQHLVEMRDGVFFPQNLQILQGDTILFKNVDNKSHWPASNIHPSHSIYPEFDPKKEILVNESWSFTFTKDGSWRFHDHIFPTMIGTITVNKDADFIEDKPNQSFLDYSKQLLQDLKIEIDKVYYKFSPQKIDQELDKFKMQDLVNDEKQLQYWLTVVGGPRLMDKLVKDTGGGSIADCHQEAHTIGRIAFSIYGAKLFKESNYNCHSGFIHGAMETFLKDKGIDNLAENIKNLCASLPTSFGVFECLHGVGHGVLAYLDYDLPLAIKACNKLSDDFSRSSCVGGMFMENVVTAQGRGAKIGHDTRWVSSDPHFPCNAIDTSYSVQNQCYLMQTSRMLDIYGYNFDKVALECLNAPDQMKSVCFQSYGRDAAGNVLRNPAKILEKCNKVPKEYFNYCIDGSLNVIIDFWGEGIVDQPQSLCKLLIRSDEKVHCYSLLGSRLLNVFGSKTQKIRELCNVAEQEYINTCLKSSQI